MSAAALRLAVRKRARSRCEYCRLPDLLPHLVRFQLEHIQAKRHAGPTTLTNLAWSCPRCNERKGTNLSAIDPDTNRIARVFNPRRDAWTRHFVCEGLHIRGTTALGRATVWLLEFNSEERLKLRAGLDKLGLWVAV